MNYKLRRAFGAAQMQVSHGRAKYSNMIHTFRFDQLYKELYATDCVKFF